MKIGGSNVPRTILPEIVPSTTVIGAIRKNAASELGLDNAPSVVIGAGDGATAAVGAGVVSASDGAFACLGTSSWISVASKRPLLDPQKRTMTFNHAVAGEFLPMATMQTAGGALDWVASAVAPGNDGGTIATLVGEAATVTAARDGLFFMPYLLGERSPLWDPDIRASFVGLSRATRARISCARCSRGSPSISLRASQPSAKRGWECGRLTSSAVGRDQICGCRYLPTSGALTCAGAVLSRREIV